MITTTFNIQSLTQQNIEQFMNLQGRVYDALPQEEKKFIVPRSVEVITQHLNKNMPLLGAIAQGRLIAATCVSYPNHEKMKDYVSACQENIDIDDISIVESVYVCPNHRQKGLATNVAKEACKMAFNAGRPKIIAEIADGNIASIKTFEKLGFKTAGQYISPEDRCKVIMVANRAYRIGG